VQSVRHAGTVVCRRPIVEAETNRPLSAARARTAEEQRIFEEAEG
jgi:hypothetical protein